MTVFQNPRRYDPYMSFKFEVELFPGSGAVAGFNKVTGMGWETEVTDYREGGENSLVHKLPGLTTSNEVSFEVGMSQDMAFVDWANDVFNLDNPNGQGGVNDPNFRHTIAVYLKDKAGLRVRQWTLYHCWPSTYEVGDLDAQSSDVLMQTLTIQTEGIREKAVRGVGAAVAAAII